MEEEFVPFVELAGNGRGSVEVEGNDGDHSHILMTDMKIPWLPKIVYRGNENPLLILHSEIVQFSQLMSLSEAELANREEILEEIRKIAQRIFPGCQVHAFGSHVSKILTPKSDLDIVSCLYISLHNFILGNP